MKLLSNENSARSDPAARRVRCVERVRLLVRQREHRQIAAERGVIGKSRIAADRAQTRRVDGLVGSATPARCPPSEWYSARAAYPPPAPSPAVSTVLSAVGNLP